MNKAMKWRKRARRWKRIMITQAEQIDALYGQKNDEINRLSEHEAAALNTWEELRRDCVRLATELARVQKHAATIADLRERQVKLTREQQGNSAIIALNKTIVAMGNRNDRLLAWQRRAREAVAHYKKAHLSDWCAPLEDVYRAIEAEPKEAESAE